MSDIRSMENEDVDGELSIHEELMTGDEYYLLKCNDCGFRACNLDGFEDGNQCPECGLGILESEED